MSKLVIVNAGNNFDSTHLLEMYTQSEIDKALLDSEVRRLTTLRQLAYKAESDPLNMEWRFEVENGNDAADEYKQKWLVAVNQIKARYPLSTET